MLEADWLVQIYANDTEGDPCIGTGYSIGNGLILTARHVVLFDNRAEDPQLKLVWPEQNKHEISFTDADIVFKGDEKIDLAIIRCPESPPFQPPNVKLASVNPSIHDQWSSRGFLRAGKEGGTRTDRGVSGTVVGIKGHEVELHSSIEVTEKNGWAGLSGAPVFIDKQLVAVITVDYTTIKSYLLALSIPYLLRENESFRQEVGLTKQAVIDEISVKLHTKIIKEMIPVLNGNHDLLSELINVLQLDAGATVSDIATYLVKQCGTGHAISKLAKISLNLEKLISSNIDRWKEYLYDAEQLCGWLLINSVDPEWWLQNEQRLEKAAHESVTNILELDAKAYIEIIISRSLLQQAKYTLDSNGDIVPASEIHNPMLFDAVSPGASEIQLLSEIFKELRRSNNAPQNVSELLNKIEITARSLYKATDNKLIYYIVSEDYLNALKAMSCFDELRRKLAGHLQFICCVPKSSGERSPCEDDQNSLLEDVAVILRLRTPKRTTHA